jgi:hypothetical protein
MAEPITDILLLEYEILIGDIGDAATDDQIVARLTTEHDWTEAGATTVLALARQYGTAILRNALALASAMQIEDGSVGL